MKQLLALTAGVSATLVALATPARAAPEVDLDPPMWAARFHLRAPAGEAEPPAEATAIAADDGELGAATHIDDLITNRSHAADIEPARRLSEKVIFRVNLGFGLDGGERNCTGPANARTCEPMASGSDLDQREAYASLRAYGFGDVVLGSRGLGVSSLASYFAARFRFDQSTGRLSTGVPSVHDASAVDNVLVRSGYAEAHQVFSNRFLAPLYLRAGRQFRYGPAIAHFDGVTLGYDTRAFSMGAFVGSRVSMYGFPTGTYFDRGGLITGVNARFDMYELKQVPLVLSGNMLSFDKSGHFQGGVAIRWSPDILVGATMRIRGRSFTRQRLSLRARISRVTTINAELEHRAREDWAYDLMVADTPYDATDPRRYLNLSVPLPRTYVNVRAGTVLLDNIDLLLRGAAAIVRVDDSQFEPSTFSSSYLEAGIGLEVRARRAIAIGAALLSRSYRREAWQDLTGDNDNDVADPLPTNTGAIGERSFTEGGFTVRFSQGMRTFGAGAEIYGRLYSPQSPYIAPADEEYDFRGGGRFSVDGWASKRMHLRVEYDVAFVPTNVAPEIRGVKSLRVLAEGTF